MSTTRSTYGAILGTVTSAASALTTALSTMDTTVGMAATAIDDAARRQKARSKLDELAYKDSIAKEKSMELELQQESIIDWCDEVEGRAERFKATYDRLRAALD